MTPQAAALQPVTTPLMTVIRNGVASFRPIRDVGQEQQGLPQVLA